MEKFGIQDHEIYKKRGRMNKQIGILLGAFVMIVIIATMAKLSSTNEKRLAQTQAVTEQAE